MDHAAALVAALRDHSADCTQHQSQQMAAHWALVCQWAPRLNLTSINDPSEAALLHYVDALAVLPHLQAGPVADIGSGAGYPGVIVAIMRPEQRVYLVEPRRKRASFLQVVVARLNLTNAVVLEQRSEAGPPEPCGSVVTRAAFSSWQGLTALGSWLAPGGSIIAQRGSSDDAPLAPAGCEQGRFGALDLEGPARTQYSLAGRPRWCDVWRLGETP